MKLFGLRFLVAALLFALVGTLPGLQQPVYASRGAMQSNFAELPSLNAAVTLTKPRTIHAPYLPVGNVTSEKFSEMGIFWFGKVTTSQNYTDVRVGYNDTALFIHASVFDRLVWYDTKHDPNRLTKFDSATIYLNTGPLTATSLSTSSYRFDAQMSWYEDRSLYQSAYTGNGTTWVKSASLPFTSERGYSGGQFNNGKTNRGWAMGFEIPFSSLGLTGKPADGTTWNFAIVVHDKDTAATVLADKKWPELAVTNKPSSWGRLSFGSLPYQPAASMGGAQVTIRHKLNGANVPDAGVGGDIGHLCDDSALWTKWGSYNFKGRESVNIQNQSNLADWPCYAKFYVTFPLGQVPRGKVIKSAKLVMYEWGGSDWSIARPSLIQVSTVRSDWAESTINWNNAPIPLENVAQTWVNPVPHAIQSNEWPGWEYDWDVSAAVAEAYQAGAPLRLALYEADSEMHSGKYFVTAQTGDWNAKGRPTLLVEWGDSTQ